LTKGERFLIGIVGQNIYTRFMRDYDGYNSVLDLPQTDLDMSKISSITMRYTAFDSLTSVVAFGTRLGPNTNGTETKTFTPVNGNISVIVPRSFADADTRYCYFIITSFTTKDGKVHTADNLNY
jgi:hypothetical protein